jgi:hypothetical protein
VPEGEDIISRNLRNLRNFCELSEVEKQKILSTSLSNLLIEQCLEASEKEAERHASERRKVGHRQTKIKLAALSVFVSE